MPLPVLLIALGSIIMVFFLFGLIGPSWLKKPIRKFITWTHNNEGYPPIEKGSLYYVDPYNDSAYNALKKDILYHAHYYWWLWLIALGLIILGFIYQ